MMTVYILSSLLLQAGLFPAIATGFAAGGQLLCPSPASEVALLAMQPRAHSLPSLVPFQQSEGMDHEPHTVTQFPFLGVPITQHPTFIWLRELKQQENSHCTAGGRKYKEGEECVSTVSPGSTMRTLM